MFNLTGLPCMKGRTLSEQIAADERMNLYLMARAKQDPVK